MSARTIGYIADEDAARVEVCQIIHSQRYQLMVRKNVVPSDWDDKTRHVDIGIGEMKASDQVIYGGLELKWSSKSFSGSVRRDVIQDVVRLASIHPPKQVVRFLVMGGCLSLDDLFSAKHSSETVIGQRDFFCDLLAEHLNDPTRVVTTYDLRNAFPDAYDRLPASASQTCTTIRTTLLASAELDRKWNDPSTTDHIVVEKWGEVRVWQIDPEN